MVRKYFPMCRTAQYFGLSQPKLPHTTAIKDSFQTISIACNLLKYLKPFLQQTKGMPRHHTVISLKVN